MKPTAVPDLAAMLKPLLAGYEGFVRAESFASLSEDGKILSMNVWTDKTAAPSLPEGRQGKSVRILQDYGLLDAQGIYCVREGTGAGRLEVRLRTVAFSSELRLWNTQEEDIAEETMDSCELDAIRQEIREEFQSELARRDRQIEALREELKRRVDVYSVSHELEMVRTQIRFEIVQHEGRTVEAWGKAFIIGGLLITFGIIVL